MAGVVCAPTARRARLRGPGRIARPRAAGRRAADRRGQRIAGARLGASGLHAAQSWLRGRVRTGRAARRARARSRLERQCAGRGTCSDVGPWRVDRRRAPGAARTAAGGPAGRGRGVGLRARPRRPQRRAPGAARRAAGDGDVPCARGLGDARRRRGRALRPGAGRGPRPRLARSAAPGAARLLARAAAGGRRLGLHRAGRCVGKRVSGGDDGLGCAALARPAATSPSRRGGGLRDRGARRDRALGPGRSGLAAVDLRCPGRGLGGPSGPGPVAAAGAARRGDAGPAGGVRRRVRQHGSAWAARVWRAAAGGAGRQPHRGAAGLVLAAAPVAARDPRRGPADPRGDRRGPRRPGVIAVMGGLAARRARGPAARDLAVVAAAPGPGALDRARVGACALGRHDALDALAPRDLDPARRGRTDPGGLPVEPGMAGSGGPGGQRRCLDVRRRPWRRDPAALR